MSENLPDKVAIVTGGAQGLGQAISQRLAREGCVVVIADLNEKGVADTAAAIAKETSRRVVGMRTDVTQEPDVKSLFDRVVLEFGRVDIVVANAAILIAEPIADADAEKWRAVMNVNLFGYFLVTKHACRIMKQQRSGSIININSKSGKKAAPPIRPMLRANSAVSVIRRVLPSKWHRSTFVAMPSVPGDFWIRRYGRIRKKVCSSNICVPQSSRCEKHRGRPAGLCRSGADEARLQLRRCRQRGRVSCIRTVIIHHRYRH